MASGTQLLLPQANFAFLVILYAAIILALVIFVSYKRYASILKWICLSLVTYVITGFIIPLNWGQVLLAALVPHIEWNFAFMFLVVGILGTTISPYMIFWEPDEEVEEEIEAGILPSDGDKPKLTKGYLGKMKIDTFIGMLCSEIITFFIIVTTATTLHVHGITNIQTPIQAASALQPLVHSFPNAGLLTKILFSIGIIGIGFLAVPIFAGSTSYAIAETFGFEEGLSHTFSQAKIFYVIIIASTVVGVLMNFLGINPFSALRTPQNPQEFSSFLNIRVADIHTLYQEWRAKGAEFITEPKQHRYEIRCYMRDPDGYIIEVGQTTGIPGSL